jgi:hypothetical protein
MGKIAQGPIEYQKVIFFIYTILDFPFKKNCTLHMVLYGVIVNIITQFDIEVFGLFQENFASSIVSEFWKKTHFC